MRQYSFLEHLFVPHVYPLPLCQQPYDSLDLLHLHRYYNFLILLPLMFHSESSFLTLHRFQRSLLPPPPVYFRSPKSYKLLSNLRRSRFRD